MFKRNNPPSSTRSEDVAVILPDDKPSNEPTADELARLRDSIISINRGRLGRGAEDVLLKNQELMS